MPFPGLLTSARDKLPNLFHPSGNFDCHCDPGRCLFDPDRYHCDDYCDKLRNEASAIRIGSFLIDSLRFCRSSDRRAEARRLQTGDRVMVDGRDKTACK